MRQLPRPNQEIFDTGVIWTPDKMPEALDAAFTEIEGGIGSGTSGAMLAAWFGSGRLIDAPVLPDAGDDFLPPSPTLSLALPSGLRWVQEGTLIPVEADVLVPGVPPSFEGWITLHATWDEVAQAHVWSLTPYAVRPAFGSGVLGKAISDLDGVTSVDVSEEDSDVLPTLPYLLWLLANIGAGGNGGTGGGSFDSGPLLDRIASLEADVRALKDAARGDIAPAAQLPDESLQLEVMAGFGYLIEQFPGLQHVLRGSYDIPGVTGNREPLAGGPARRGYRGGNVQRNARERSLQ